MSAPTDRYISVEVADLDDLQDTLNDDDYAYYDVVSVINSGSGAIVIMKKTRWE